MIVILYGQPGSGKTTLARALADDFPRRAIIDGDDFRAFSRNTDFSTAGRRENISAAHDVAAFIWRRDRIPVILALVSPFADLRERLKAGAAPVVAVRLVSSRPDRRDHHVETIENGPGDPILDTDRPLATSLEELRESLQSARTPGGRSQSKDERRSS